MSKETQIRECLAKHLIGGEAFMPISEMLEKVSFDDINIRPNNLPYSIYELFFHISFAQKDIINFTCSPNYHEPNWPDDYWPKEKVCPTKEGWESLKAEYKSDKERLIKYILDGSNNLTDPVKNGEGTQSLLREVLLSMEHNAYHTGQLMILLRLLNLN